MSAGLMYTRMSRLWRVSSFIQSITEMQTLSTINLSKHETPPRTRVCTGGHFTLSLSEHSGWHGPSRSWTESNFDECIQERARRLGDGYTHSVSTTCIHCAAVPRTRTTQRVPKSPLAPCPKEAACVAARAYAAMCAYAGRCKCSPLYAPAESCSGHEMHGGETCVRPRSSPPDLVEHLGTVFRARMSRGKRKKGNQKRVTNHH